jgi:hypothetical protein
MGEFAMNGLAGVRFVESTAMVETVEDWSRVRSPSRAQRRRRYGHPQNIRMVSVPRKDAITVDGGRTYYMHPEAMKALSHEMHQEQDRLLNHALLNGAQP